MLKFIKGHMDTIGGIEIYPIISFAIFFLFFVVVTTLVIKARKEHIDHMSALPLDDSEGQLTDKAS